MSAIEVAATVLVIVALTASGAFLIRHVQVILVILAQRHANAKTHAHTKDDRYDDRYFEELEELYDPKLRGIGIDRESAKRFAKTLGPFLVTPLVYALRDEEAKKYLFNQLEKLRRESPNNGA